MACRTQQTSEPKTRQNSGQTTQSLASSGSRESRNKAEKQRRDRLNKYINDLSMEVPLISMATKKMDKTSILRLSAAYLRINNVMKTNSVCDDSSKLDDQLASTILGAMNGFLLVLNGAGKIVFVSEDADRLLGYASVDLLGHSVYNIVHPDDRHLVRKHVDTPGRCSFHCRMTERKLSRSEPSKFDTVHIVGHRRIKRRLSLTDADDGSPPNNRAVLNGNGAMTSGERGRGAVDFGGAYNRLAHVCPCYTQPTLRSGVSVPAPFCYLHRDCYTSAQNDESLFVGVVRLVRNQPITEISLLDAFRDEYITHHLLDGRIIAADHRISVIAGYLPSEVVGFSAYQYICADDIALASIAHRQMFMVNGGGRTSDGFEIRATYKLMSKTNTFIYLMSKGLPRFDSVTKKLESFICINYLLTKVEGEKELNKLRYHYSPAIFPSATSPPLSQGAPESDVTGYPVNSQEHYLSQISPSSSSYSGSSCDGITVAPISASVGYHNQLPVSGRSCQYSGLDGAGANDNPNGGSLRLVNVQMYMNVQNQPLQRNGASNQHNCSNARTIAQRHSIINGKNRVSISPPVFLVDNQSKHALVHQAAASDLSPAYSQPQSDSLSQSSISGEGYSIVTDPVSPSSDCSQFNDIEMTSFATADKSLSFFPTPFTWSSLMNNGMSYQEFSMFE